MINGDQGKPTAEELLIKILRRLEDFGRISAFSENAQDELENIIDKLSELKAPVIKKHLEDVIYFLTDVRDTIEYIKQISDGD